ncbi:MAG TPA: hypothetical protein VID69_08845 [Actinomycetota bacterium]
MRTPILSRMRREEGGYVLVVVLLSLILVLSLMTGVMSYAVGSRDLSAHDQDWNAALAAAEAGIDDYMFRLNQDGSYWQYSDVNPPPDGNLAFDQWVAVPGAASDAQFRYRVDTSSLAVDGTVHVTSSGRVGNVTRTIDASMRRRNFLDFLYFTDFETQDPILYSTSQGDDYTPTDAQTYCAHYYYGSVTNPPSRRDIGNVVRSDFTGDADPNPTCTEISFATVDVINGPLHSNDAIRISGNPQFLGDTSTSWDDPSGQHWWGSGSPDFLPGDPELADPLTMPPSNVEIKNETDSGQGGTGCLFTGPTAINLRNDGTMDVISPFSKAINCSVSPNPNANLYYTEGASAFTITRMQLPPNGVIYVQNVPSSVSDANYTAGCPFAGRPSFGGGTTRTHPLGLPQRFDITPTSTGTTPTGYGCRNGDVIVSGTLDGRLTIAADNNVILFGSTTYEDANGDLLGLIANNYIEVYHPINTSSTTNCLAGSTVNGGCLLRMPRQTSSDTPSLYSGSTPGTSTMASGIDSNQANTNPSIKAALLTLQHSFRVQNYNYGDDDDVGELRVTGAIAQKYRGIVGLINTTGYAKDYVYDQRLKYDSPPKFLNPVASAWQVVTWAECSTSTCAPEVL